MSKWIKSLWNKFFSTKVKVTELVLKHCGKHSRYKKSCPECRKAV